MSPLRTAEVIAVGSELLGATRVDTNSLYLSERLASAGVELRAKSVVGDSRADVARFLREALRRVDLVILTGGLGPTDDDVTRDAVSDVLHLPLVEDPAIVEHIARRFARRGLEMPAVNRKQALVPRGATVIPNPHGTAPGLLLEGDGRVILLLPGPPRELQPMFESLMTGPLAPLVGRELLMRAALFVTGRTESHVEAVAQPIYSRWRTEEPAIETTILASPGQIELHLTLRAGDRARGSERLGRARDELVAALGDDVFSTDGRLMEQVVGDMLRERGMRIAVAESCTGGLLLSRLTDVPGSSAWVQGGVVVYSNRSKSDLVDVPAALIAEYGAVSEPVAAAMAEGVRRRMQAEIGVGITGIAGPSGGSTEKPVGTVAMAAAVEDGSARARTAWFPGGRALVKFAATQAALDMVRRALR